MVRFLPMTAMALLVGATLLPTGCGCTSCDSGPTGVAPPAETVMLNFVLNDVNPNSVTYQDPDSPRAHIGHISAWYFGSATWSYCVAQFGRLDTMQTELGAEVLTRPVHIHGVNSVGAESGNAAACAGRTIPWLQDTSSENVWDLWEVTYRDVIILDPSNEVAAVFNLTTHDLSIPAEYEALKTLLRDAANAP